MKWLTDSTISISKDIEITEDVQTLKDGTIMAVYWIEMNRHVIAMADCLRIEP